ncbi:hypothetical protein ACERIT_01320 [Halopenitus sp. H-Gu1]|uniref:DUF7286 family protein n=1 Tax=Halopenitus sp. H-Gu1 TaxID=3242697 RepID=UPI00359CCCA0
MARPDTGRTGGRERRRRGRIALVSDRRARVPFALIGVLLIVTSTAYASGIATTDVTIDRSVERAVERSSADATPALRSATASAAREAAARPVTQPAETTAGSALRPNSAFEDALRIRIGVAAHEALASTSVREGGVRAETTLSFGEDGSGNRSERTRIEPGDLDRVRDRVTITPVANGTALKATIHGVRTTARRDGRVVSERTRPITVVVAVPVLAAHERTETFETAMNRGALEGPGLGRQLTARLYALTWARGYAQRFGAPVQNVLANRHVELSSNTGTIAVQRGTFGAADSDATTGTRRATARTGLADLLEPTGVDESEWSRTVLEAPVPSTGESQAGGEPYGDPLENATETVSIGPSTDAALVETLDTSDSIAHDAYRVQAVRRVEVTRTGGRTGAPPRSSPGSNWTFLGERTTSDATAHGSGGDSGFDSASRSVTVERKIVRYWTDGTSRRTTQKRWSERYRVVVSVDGRYAPRAGAPDRSTSPTFHRGGAIDGPNLESTPEAARRALDATDVDAVAREAAKDGATTRTAVIHGTRPTDLEAWIRKDVAALHDRLEEMETTVDMRAVAAGATDPYGRLAADVRTRRDELVAPPATYDGASDRARVAVRRAYVDAVIADLERRSKADRSARDELDEAAGAGATTDSRAEDESQTNEASLGEYVAASGTAQDPEPFVVGEEGPTGGVAFTPNGTPGYLPRTTIDGSVGSIASGSETRPLVTRNVNVFTMPYGDVSSEIVDRVLALGDRVPLPQATGTLTAADRTLEEADDEDRIEVLRTRRDRLEADVQESTEQIEQDVEVELRTTTDLSASERRSAIQHTRDRYETTAKLATAMTSGEYAEALANEIERTSDGRITAGERTRLEAVIRTSLTESMASKQTAVSRSHASRTADVTRRIARSRIESGVEEGLQTAANETETRWGTDVTKQVGAGLPVTPVPGYWYATVNVWHVEVAGEYPRFELRADVGPPDEEFRYVRADRPSTIDLEGDPVTLGYSEPIRFRTDTTVVIAVPPGPPGVGDVDGTWSEESSGWACPGPSDRRCEADP